MLSYEVFFPIFSKKAPLLVLHGLLGSKTNWKSLATLLSATSGREVYTLDARNHGESFHSENFNYGVMADDVTIFGERKGLKSFSLLGHSMGGRTAMFIALTRPQAIEKLVVVDVSPVSMPPSSTITMYLKIMKNALKNTPLNNTLMVTRQCIDTYMAQYIPEMHIRQFLLTNLKIVDGRICWKVNIQTIEKCFDEIQRFPSLSTTFEKDALFLYGENSPYLKSEDYGKICKLFPKARFIGIKDAAHWVHSDNPKEFLKNILSFL